MTHTTEGASIEFVETVSMRIHPLHKRHLPEPALDSPEWHGFVDGISGAGPEGMVPLFATDQNLIMDGGRRWKAARQLQWDCVPVMRRPDELAAVIMWESLLGQKHLIKGQKAYLALGFVAEYVESAERRRLTNLRQNRKTTEKALKLPKCTECTSEESLGKDADEVASRLGVSRRLLFQAFKVRKLFLLAHKFEFQDGRVRTLKEHFEPQLLDTESPMGLGEVLKGCGWFVDEEGNPKKQLPPPDRNSYLHYFESAWGNFHKQFARWEKLKTAERARAVEIVTAGVREWPGEVREELGRAIKRQNQ